MRVKRAYISFISLLGAYALLRVYKTQHVGVLRTKSDDQPVNFHQHLEENDYYYSDQPQVDRVQQQDSNITPRDNNQDPGNLPHLYNNSQHYEDTDVKADDVQNPDDKNLSHQHGSTKEPRSSIQNINRTQPQHIEQRTSSYLTEKQDLNGIKVDRCVEKTNIYLSKVPKCASSTIANLLWRFGIGRNLTLMTFRGKQYPYPDTYRARLNMPSVPSFHGLFNILAEHSRLDEAALQQLMPPDTVYVATVREPLLRMHAYLLAPDWHSIVNMSLETFLVRLDLQDPQLGIFRSPRHATIFRHNMAVFYGYDPRVHALPAYLSYLADRYAVVVVFERLDESLVMMRRRLCWKLKDVIIYRYGLRKRNYNHSATVNLSDDLRAKFMQWQPGDMEIYSMFSAKLQTQIEEEGSGFMEEVECFRQILSQVGGFCQSVCQQLQESSPSMRSTAQMAAILKETVHIPRSNWDEEFVFSGYECLLMMINPKILIKAQNVKQNPEICTAAPDDPYCAGPFAMNGVPWEALLWRQAFLSHCF